MLSQQPSTRPKPAPQHPNKLCLSQRSPQHCCQPTWATASLHAWSCFCWSSRIRRERSSASLAALSRRCCDCAHCRRAAVVSFSRWARCVADCCCARFTSSISRQIRAAYSSGVSNSSACHSSLPYLHTPQLCRSQPAHNFLAAPGRQLLHTSTTEPLEVQHSEHRPQTHAPHASGSSMPISCCSLPCHCSVCMRPGRPSYCSPYQSPSSS